MALRNDIKRSITTMSQITEQNRIAQISTPPFKNMSNKFIAFLLVKFYLIYLIAKLFAFSRVVKSPTRKRNQVPVPAISAISTKVL